ncbi:MAG: bacillithiol biosynthesis cysteine-adding enzyme BshC [Thermoanaerobaculia bacterium]|nr:bacillithiol biosynthesis cysteine-adding enzyme BshC [Thermoanaerobaculia bacterium]
MIVNASSSSATRPTDLPARLAPHLAAWHSGNDLDLLGELRLLRDASIPTLPEPGFDRSTIAAALGVANRGYGHPDADRLAKKLADPTTRVVITGQQPGLFGGPLYSLLKMLGTVLWADALEAAGTPAVALFWVATEDHDYTEVSAATFWPPKSDNEPLRVSLPADPDGMEPVGNRPLGIQIEAIFEELREVYGWPSFQAGLEEIAQSYGAEAHFGEAFCRYAASLVGARAPLFVDAQLPAVKKAQAPYFRQLIERRGEVATALAGAEEAIVGRGYDLQVRPQPDAAPLMLVRDRERRRVVWSGEDGYVLRGGDEERPVAELLEELESDPAAFTPNVLSRPVLQDAIFGTGLQVLGPGEMSYFAQAAPLYPLLGVTAPSLVLRPQALLFDARQGRQLEGLALPPDLLLADDDAVDHALAAASGAPSIAPVETAIEGAMEVLRTSALALDPNLERPWEKTRDQMLGALGKFSERITRAAGHRDQVTRGRLDGLRAYAAPGGVPHERVLCTGYFHGRFGRGLVSQLLGTLSRQPGRVQVLTLGEDEDA